MIRKRSNGGVEVIADLHVGIADLSFRSLANTPLSEQFLKTPRGEEEAANRIRNIALFCLLQTVIIVY